ncbi:MAG: ABC transporter permease subunit [Oscillospiraceae bacterium]|nr:ABC transporter permease subunit [Oscillospiraceae bacterium]
MRKLLSADFSRLWKNKVFWACMGAMLLYAVIYMLNGCKQASLHLTDYNYSIDQYYFHFAVSIGVFCALFSSMFLGTEYSDGTIRNKIAAGHTKAAIYMAGLVTATAATLLMMSAWLIGALVAVPTLGVWQMGVAGLLLYLLIAVMCVAAFSAICTFINMLCTNKAASVAISLLLILGLLIFSSMLYNALQEPEMTSGVQITANGVVTSESLPNPNYISGVTRKIYELVLDVLPTGQGLNLWWLKIAHPVRMLVSSAAITLFTTLGGIFIFKKKNLK